MEIDLNKKIVSWYKNHQIYATKELNKKQQKVYPIIKLINVNYYVELL